MRKLFVVSICLIIFVLATLDNFGQGSGNGPHNRGKGINCRFVDLNNDGKCDYFVDLNNDGRCDLGGKRFRKSNCDSNFGSFGKGKGTQQRNFVDSDGDGVCDNYQNKVFISRPHPNPFSVSTNFEVYLPRNGEIQVTLNDLMGKVIKNIFQGNLEKGKHNFSIDSKDLIPGRYLIVVRFEDKIFSKQVHYNP